MVNPQTLKIACPNCSGHVEFPAEMQGQIINCPHCSLSMPLELRGGSSRRTSSSSADSNCLPDVLPTFSSLSLQTIQVKSSDGKGYYSVDLLNYTCTCPSFVKDHAHAPPFSFGRMCKHICDALDREKLPLPPIAQAMVREAHGVHPGRIATDINGNLIYITGINSTGWVNVFALPRKDGKSYSRYGYNIKEARWAYGQEPKIAASLLPSLADLRIARYKKWTITILSICGWILKAIRRRRPD
jgi:hypothetical protein